MSDPETNPEIVEMAEAFANLDAEEQAQFFSALHADALTWDRGMASFREQMQWAYDSKEATAGGRDVMLAIGLMT